MVPRLLRALRLCSCSLFGDHQRMAVSLVDCAGGPSKHTGSCSWLRCVPGVALLWAFQRVWVLCPHRLACCSPEALLAVSAWGQRLGAGPAPFRWEAEPAWAPPIPAKPNLGGVLCLLRVCTVPPQKSHCGPSGLIGEVDCGSAWLFLGRGLGGTPISQRSCFVAGPNC